MSVVKKRLRFTDIEDLLLLREVLSNNPYENPGVWEIIQQNISLTTGKFFTIRTLKEHLELLIKLWIEQVKIIKDKSGIEIEFTEKNNLCESVYLLMNEHKKEKRDRKTSITEKKLGIDARHKWSSHYTSTGQQPSTSNEGTITNSIAHDHSSLIDPEEIEIEIIDTEEIENVDPNFQERVPDDSDANVENIDLTEDKTPAAITPRQKRVLAPVKSRKRRINPQRQGLAYLASYDEGQKKIKEKELGIEERKLALEERKLALEERKIALQEKQIDMTYMENKNKNDLEEKKLNLIDRTVNEVAKVIETQANIINLLLKKSSES